MPKSVFLYLAVSLIFLQLFSLSDPTIETALDLFSLTAILTLGIAHGSIDHVLFTLKRKTSTTVFIAVYLIALVVNFALWFIFPQIALLAFLVFSAYHFGQSQLIDLEIHSNLWTKFFYLVWGSSILSALLYFNTSEVYQLFFDPTTNSSIFDSILNYSENFFYLSTTIFLSMGVYFTSKGLIHIQQLLLELVQLLIILTSFYLFPVIIGFSLYFIILHSFRVLLQEYAFLKKSEKIKSILHFTKLLLPFTLLSIIGLLVILLTSYLLELNISMPFILIALTSAVTLPHVLVMEYFYYKS